MEPLALDTCSRMCRQEVKEAHRVPRTLWQSRRRSSIFVRSIRDSRASGQYHFSPRPRAHPPPFNPVLFRYMHAKDRWIARRLFGSHSRRDSPASEESASPLARSLGFLTCTSTRGSVWRATDCSRAPATPFIIAADHGPAAPPVRSRSSPILTPRWGTPRNRAVAGVV